MIVEQIWTGNAYRNFNYIVACPETGEALAIDPLDESKWTHRAVEVSDEEKWANWGHFFFGISLM